MSRQQIVRVGREFVLVSLAFIGLSSPGIAADTVVVYSALDREFADPVLKAYGERSGVRVLPKFDVESTKTVGLTNLIIAEARRPRCDLFWNNEILNTLRLKERGLLAPFHPHHAGDLPETFKAKDRTWYGFAARGRVLIVNTKLVAGNRTTQEDQQICSTPGGRGRSESPSRSSARRPLTPPACSPRGATKRPRASSVI